MQGTSLVLHIAAGDTIMLNNHREATLPAAPKAILPRPAGLPYRRDRST